MWIAILICSIILFVLLSYIILPKYLLKVTYTGLNPFDNVAKVVDEKYTSATIYRFDDARYVEKYALVKKNGFKQVVCKLHSFVKSIVYDVVLFDANNKILNILTVNERVLGTNYTKEIKVSDKVERIVIAINKVNGKEIFNKFKKTYVKGGMIGYILITSLLFFALGIVFQISLINLLGDVFYQDMIASNLFYIIPVLGFVLYAIVASLILKFRKF